MNNYLEDVENQSDSWQENQNTKTPKEGSIHQATRCPRAQNVKSIDKSEQPKDRGEFPAKQDSNTHRQSENQEEKHWPNPESSKMRKLKNLTGVARL